MASSIAIDARDVLVIIDVETNFFPGGSHAVADGDPIVPLVDRLARAFDNVVFTQGLHPSGRTAIASDPGAKPFDGNATSYGDQAPLFEHCGPGEQGADLGAGLVIDRAFLILSKGGNGEVESHSASSKAEGETTMGLATLLKARGIQPSLRLRPSDRLLHRPSDGRRARRRLGNLRHR